MDSIQDKLEFWRMASEVAHHAYTNGDSISKETCDSVTEIYNNSQKSFDEMVSALISGTYKPKDGADT